MKKHISLILLATVLGVLGASLFFVQAGAQIDAFTFFIPFPADQLDQLFDIGNNDFNFIDEDITTTISIAMRRDGTIIYYDHWEDGLEDNLTSPTQTSTQIWGDNNPANGSPPGFPSDVLSAGAIITLQNVVELPRDPGQIRYDGGDKLTAEGGSIAVSLANWPTRADVSSLYAGAWELTSTSLWGLAFVVPVGVDLFGTGPGQRGAWGVVAVNVQAVEDGTQVQLDLDSDGSFEQTVTLDEGQQFTQTSGNAVSGAMIMASNPVQLHLFTANPSPGINWEARAYTLLPIDQLANEYLVPRSSDGDHWLYNPHDTPLTVEAQTQTGTETIVIPPESTAQYPAGALSGATGVRFFSPDGRPFDGLTALDADFVQDWGYAWYPIDFLTPQVLISWAPGNNRVPPSSWTGDPGGLTASRIYVTAASDTTLTVIYDLQDRSRDTTITISALEEVAIFDPVDYDMSGAVLISNEGRPIVAVWGQDQDAPRAQPSIDVGTGVVPLASLTVQKEIMLAIDADGSGGVTWGDTLRFEIAAVNNTTQVLRDTIISDTLPTSVEYVPGSSTARNAPIADDSPPRTIFPFDEGGYLVGDLQLNEVVTGTFDAIVKDGVDEVCNTASADSPSVTRPEDAEACVPAGPPIVTPTPTPTVTPTPTNTPTPEPDEPDDDEDPTRTPPPPPPPTSPPSVPTSTPDPFAPTPEPTPPVLFLPETGTRDGQAGSTGVNLLFLLAVCLALAAIGTRLIHRRTR